MKKFSLIIGSLLLFCGLSFAQTTTGQKTGKMQQSKTTHKTTGKTVKSKPVPATTKTAPVKQVPQRAKAIPVVRPNAKSTAK